MSIPTLRQQRLARAINNLSSRDLIYFTLAMLPRHCPESEKYRTQIAILEYADKILANAQSETIKTGENQ